MRQTSPSSSLFTRVGLLVPHVLRSWREETLWFEWLRFVAIGLKSNVLYYVLYVLFVYRGIGPNAAVTLVFLVGVAYSFWLHKRFVFRNLASARRQIAAYLLLYSAAWCLNLLALNILLGPFQVNRYIAQGILIIPFAAAIFLSLKYIVFRHTPESLPITRSSFNNDSSEATEVR